jgi:acyl-CoA synthetase (AMP-forming)/AMP-acid ligase II
VSQTIRNEVIAQLTAADGPLPVATAVVRGVTYRVHTNSPANLREVFSSGARWGDRKAITYEDESYSWSEYLGIVAKIATLLRDQYGVRKGDRVGLAMRNYPEWIFTFAATISLGAVSVPLNAWWSATELHYALADCGARIFFGDRERVERIQSVRAELPELETVIEVRPGDVPQGDAQWTELLAAAPDEASLPAADVDPDDDCTIMYTSGTTGRPKGAVATHRAHCANLMNMIFSGALEAELSALRGEPPAAPVERPVALVTGPLFHIAGLPLTYLAAVGGIQAVLMYRWNPQRALELIERERVTSAGGVPTVVRELLDAAERSDRDLSSVRTVGTGGAQSSTELIGRVERHFPGTGTAYGLTETTGPMVGIGSHDYFERPLAVGRPYATSEVRIVDPAGNDVPQGEIGESWFKGPNVARGYWNRDSDAFMADGWFRSGDLVRTDEDGFVYIVDRIKDVVIRAGENVYCSEVEDALLDHAAVQEVSVFGVPHELWGEEVVAVVQVKPNATVDPDELRAHVKDRLAAFKIPTTIVVSEEPLPRNAAGKVLKRELRAAHLDSSQAPVR